jgi:hypothetical protein
LAVKFAGPFSLSPEKGADTSVYLASSPDVAGVTGKYFTKRRAVQTTPETYDEAAAKRLWEASVNLTRLPV